MILAILTFLAAFFIEGLGTLVSVIGLSALFGSNLIIIALAVALDVGKLTIVSLLYKHWPRLGYTMRAYGLLAAVVTMVITSAGAAGYLSGEFQKAIVGVEEGAAKVKIMKEQQAKYETRKKQIDDSIDRIPDTTSARDRGRIIANFRAEQMDLQKKIASLDAQLPQLQLSQIGGEAKAGPILYVAKAFNTTPEAAVKWVIMLIIIVFDPLAVFLLVAGNFLWELRKQQVPEPVAVQIPEPAPAPEPVPEPAPAPSVPEPESHLSIEPDTPWPRKARKRRSEEPPPRQPTAPLVNSHPPADAELLPAGSDAARDVSTATVSPDRWQRQPTPRAQPAREQITLSSLGLVRPDAHTLTADEFPAIERVPLQTTDYANGR